METQKFRNQRHLFKIAADHIDTAEKTFLADTFTKLPIEKQKQILGFFKIDPFDGKKPESAEEEEYRSMLRYKGYIELNAQIII